MNTDNEINKANIIIFRLLQEKFTSFEKIFFTINDAISNGIRNKDIKIILENSVNTKFEIVIFNTSISELIKNIYNTNINEIIVNFISSAMEIYNLDYFPNFIKKLKIQLKFNCEILKKLPEDLEYLYISNGVTEIKTELNNLPNKLKILSMMNIKYNLPLDNLPSSLEKLIIHLFITYNYSLDNLPQSLNFLEIQFFLFKDISIKYIPIYNNLPDNLEVLILHNGGGFEINKYPKKLKTFELTSLKNYEIKNIPKNIEYKFKEI